MKRIDLCVVCKKPYSVRQWNERHLTPDGDWCHAECCEACASSKEKGIDEPLCPKDCEHLDDYGAYCREHEARVGFEGRGDGEVFFKCDECAKSKASFDAIDFNQERRA